MNEKVYHLLDGDLSDSDAVDMFQSLIVNSEERAAFMQQLKLHGALSRNEVHDTMSSQEELDMLVRLNAAIGLGGIASSGTSAQEGIGERPVPSNPSAPSQTTGKRFGPAAWGLIVGALMVGGTAGYVGHGAVAPPSVPQQVMSIHSASPAPLPASIATAPCNCDSIAMASVAAVRDSVQRANAPTSHKGGARRRVARVSDDPTGSRAAKLLAARRRHTR
ncbi:MAG TPA: hypothetical protein VHI13_14080 [Candidatus Kapabacteria bacterium]|nr:hypothetical protein [Candidatus Kapabacteria bacterium]